MELYYYKNREGNFGDDLNPYLWPRLIAGFTEQQPEAWFAGIGTILHEDFFRKMAGRPGIVFGSGSRGFYPKTLWASNIRVMFVRGPLSAAVLGLPADAYITDPAYAVTLLPQRLPTSARRRQPGATGFLPHYSTLRRTSQLPRLCDAVGLRFINPTSSVEEVLDALQDCEHVICEAMHGAILSDALRIPWTRITIEVPFYESDSVNEFKWNDWMLSIGTVVEAVRLPRCPQYTRKLHRVTEFTRQSQWQEKAVRQLTALKSQSQARLSLESRHSEVVERIAHQLDLVRNG